MEFSNLEVKLTNSWPVWLFPSLKGESAGRKVIAGGKIRDRLLKIIKEVFPADKDYDKSALWVTDKGKEAQNWLKEGKNVLVLRIDGKEVPRHSNASNLKVNPFDPGWWTYNWGSTYGHMGSVVNFDRLLGDFPHKGMASWQFRFLINWDKNREFLDFCRPVITSVFGEEWQNVQPQILTARTKSGGHLTYCALRVLSGRCEADYLLLQLLKNAGPQKSDPIVEVKKLESLYLDLKISTWLNDMHDKDEKVQLKALQNLKDLIIIRENSAEIMDRLLENLIEKLMKKGKMRWKATGVFRKLKGEYAIKAVSMLTEVINSNKDKETREAAIYSLGLMKDKAKGAEGVLKKILLNNNELSDTREVSGWALKDSVKFNNKELVAIFIKIMQKDKDPKMRLFAMKTILEERERFVLLRSKK
jgi:hypothetical protein